MELGRGFVLDWLSSGCLVMLGATLMAVLVVVEVVVVKPVLRGRSSLFPDDDYCVSDSDGAGDNNDSEKQKVRGSRLRSPCSKLFSIFPLPALRN